MATLVAPPPAGTRACPRCGQPAEDSTVECPSCGVVIAKARKAEAEAVREREDESTGWPARLAATDRMSIKQEAELLEAWTGFETTNSYVVNDDSGSVVFHAIEESGGVADVIVRNYLESARPFTMRVQVPPDDMAFVIKRPFRFFFSEVEVTDVLGKPLGNVKREFSVFNSVYRLTGKRPAESYEIFGPVFRPWTFKIRRQGAECGLISKKWGGLRREMLTDADAFGIEFPAGISAALKAVFLGAVFLIDFAHFEDNNG